MSDQGVIREMLDGKWLLRVMGGRELHLWEWRMRRVRSRKWEGGDTCIPTADSCWCMAETNTTLEGNYPPTEIN